MSRILVTTAASGVGQSVVDSLNQTNKYTIIGCGTDRNVYVTKFCSDFFIVPSFYTSDYLDIILNNCLKKKIDLIVPGHDQELLLFAKNIKKFNENGIEVLVSRPDLIDISRDKYEWYNYFIKFDCPVVPTFTVSDFKQNPDTSIFPAIVKPSGGSSSQGISIIQNTNELIDTKDEDIIQPYLFPRKDDANYETILRSVQNRKFVQMSEISIQLVFTKDSELKGIFISNNILRNGIPIFVDPIDPDEFEYLEDILKFAEVCKVKGVKGPVNIQGRINETGLTCFEMNMRFTGITGNRAQLGFNEVEFLVDNFLNIDTKLKGYSKNKLGARQVACTTIPRIKNSENAKRTFTIIGAGGFIGSAFVDKLIEHDSKFVINLICRKESYQKYLLLFKKKCVNVICDTEDFVQTILCQSDVLVNLASALAHRPEKDQYDSILFQYNLVQKMMKANIPLVINISSQSVYNQFENCNKDEKSIPDLDSLYAFQKHIVENFFSSIRDFSPSTKIVSMRVSRVVGINNILNTKAGGFFVNIIEKLNEGKSIDIPNPFNKTNLIDIRDVVDAILFVINYAGEDEISSILNVGGENVSLKEFCEKTIKRLNGRGDDSLVSYADSKDCNIDSTIDSSLIHYYGWKPKYKLEDTIDTILK
ncbi:NAD-dependent epimerase/dehydratase family protein [Labilibaculum sp. DW002]|uniref:NAD-dependent epimerase/dehydratase family protein n=1 Tax=Paralabilibaculum antarcticum TaxID=2912572 RepID=A0ABT5VQZ8_9BACT|nr:NAD-dependent epimerase/dehydratase family protein [Labilibaculum sp. DW002]MDE5417222.1 NAD-dependent epimerase/dehydratase family protein [Labilibaculum sp. DW002]